MAGYSANFTYRLTLSVLKVLFMTLVGCSGTVHARALLKPALKIGEW
jgi:hypothetical protein